MKLCRFDWCAGPDSGLQEQELCKPCDRAKRERRKAARITVKAVRKDEESKMKLGGIAIVCGGRNLRDRNLVFRILDWFAPTSIVHGGAPGADALAAEWAAKRGVHAAVYQADWEKHGNAAGPIRNRQMVENNPTGTVLAFPGGKGTANTVSLARQNNMPVITVSGVGGTILQPPKYTAQTFTEVVDYSKVDLRKL